MHQESAAVERARRIRLIIFDVDGVLTDGTIWLFPAPASAKRTTAEQATAMQDRGGFAMHSLNLLEAKGFHAHDGSGVSLARLGGLECALVTKRISEAVALRARDMSILGAEQLTLDQVAYLGDDVIDLPVMRVCGLAMAVADARPQVRAAAHWVSEKNGGRGAARDAIEFILEAQGRLAQALEAYIEERSRPA
jgi:3-deoxy-D-manno-octulosonate 8-phosphate phosphatase (KDO 8-P phosphatase)